MNIKHLIAAAAVSAIASTAVHAGSLTTVNANTWKFNGTADDTFTFLISGPSAVASTTVEFTGGSLDGVSLNGTAFTNVFGDGSMWSYSGLLSAGSYTISVDAGTSTTFYKGNLTVTAVPEPETYAMMLAGLGAIGFMARRRQGKAA